MSSDVDPPAPDEIRELAADVRERGFEGLADRLDGVAERAEEGDAGE